MVDLSDEVSVEGERGLFDLELLPGGDRALVSYTAKDGAVTVRILSVADGRLVDDLEDSVLVSVPHPYAGHNGGGPTTPHYAPAKAAVSNLTRTLTKEFAAQNITVNSVAPGLIDNAFHQVHTSKENFEVQLSGIPMGRAGKSEEVAGAVVFLASPAASYITGQVLHVNGGSYFG